MLLTILLEDCLGQTEIYQKVFSRATGLEKFVTRYLVIYFIDAALLQSSLTSK